MYKEVNRFPQLQADIEKASGLQDIYAASRDRLEGIGQRFRTTLIQNIPDGEDGPSGQRRPSIRLWGTRLKDAFTDTATFANVKSNSIGLIVALDHPSVEKGRDGDVLSWFQFGTKPHRIPESNTKVVFWWGSPLRWQQYGGGPGIRSSTGARQWGRSTRRGWWARPYGDFVGMAMDETEGAESDVVEDIYRSSITRPLDESSYLRRIE